MVENRSLVKWKVRPHACRSALSETGLGVPLRLLHTFQVLRPVHHRLRVTIVTIKMEIRRPDLIRLIAFEFIATLQYPEKAKVFITKCALPGRLAVGG